MLWIKRLLWVILGLFLLFAGVAAYVTYTYEDILKDTVVSSSNAYLKTPVQVSSIEVTSWKKFPYVSLVFNDVLILEDTPEQDSLIFAKHIFLNFNVYDIYKGDYSIRNIEIEQAKGRFITDKKGRENYIFWKTPENDTTSTSFALNLERVLLSDVAFSYSNLQKDILIELQTPELVFDGDFTPDKLRMYINGNLKKCSAQIDGTSYLKENELKVKTGLFVNNETSRFDFVSSSIVLDKSFQFVGDGWFDNNTYELALNSEGINYQSFLKYVGDETRDYLGRYDAKGTFDIKLSLGGKFSGSDRPKIRAKFAVRNAQLKEKETGYTIEKLSAAGSYTRPPRGSDELELSQFNGTLGSGRFEGNFSVKNLSNPYVKLDINGVADLAEWKAFFKWEDFTELKGRI